MIMIPHNIVSGAVGSIFKSLSVLSRVSKRYVNVSSTFDQLLKVYSVLVNGPDYSPSISDNMNFLQFYKIFTVLL